MRLRKDLMLATLLAAPFMAQVDTTIANVATPSIHADLHASGAQLELVIGGYLIAYAVLLITAARLGQTHGYKRVFLLGVGTFALASLLCALAPDPFVLIGGRVVQGAGAALMFPQALTGIQLHFSGPARVRAIGLYAIALSAGAVTGQILSGALISANIFGSQWRSIFFVNVPVALVVIVAALRYLPGDEPVAVRRIDGLGVGTLSAAMLLIVLPLALGRSEGWPVWTWACLAASAPAAAAFFAVERRVRDAGGAPLLNLDALSQPAVSWGLSTVAAATATYYALLFTLALYLQQGLGRSPAASGLTLVSWVAAFGLAGQIVRRLPEERRPEAAPAGCALLTVAFAAISATLFAGLRAEGALVVLLGAGGLGLGLQFSSMVGHMTAAVAPRYAPDISGATTTTITIAGAIAVAAFGTLYLGLQAGPGAASATHAFALVTSALAGIAAFACASAYRSTRVASARRSAR
jgi:predicted MFS family arabinose efflux permease